MKLRSIRTEADADDIEERGRLSASTALSRLTALENSDALAALWQMKTGALGCDPLDAETPLNLIEQLNQTFTYIASARAAKILLVKHPELAPFKLNLGTSPGPDIESSLGGGLSAEVFAAVTPGNNQKLRRDIQKVYESNAEVKYVFFMCPGYDAGHQHGLDRDGVTVWSLGGKL